MKYKENTFTGFLNIYKEAGFTSHDVVAKLRGLLKQKKIGHLGTLDPNAVGVLPIALGRATKTISLLEDHTKEYDCRMRLGVETDTYDIWGNVVEMRSVEVTEEEVEQVVISFLGLSQQTPPMYSAKKQNGKRLYELAREGKSVERPAVPIYIEEIRIVEMNLPEVTFHVACSKGTYIRSICHDIGKKLGCGACMEGLTRTRAGQFRIEEARSLSEIEELVCDFEGEKSLSNLLISIDRAFENLPKIICRKEAQRKAENGGVLSLNEILLSKIDDSTKVRLDVQKIENMFANLWKNNSTNLSEFSENNSSEILASDFQKLQAEKSPIVRAYLYENEFLGIYEWSGENFVPRKVLLA